MNFGLSNRRCANCLSRTKIKSWKRTEFCSLNDNCPVSSSPYTSGLVRSYPCVVRRLETCAKPDQTSVTKWNVSLRTTLGMSRSGDSQESPFFNKIFILLLFCKSVVLSRQKCEMFGKLFLKNERAPILHFLLFFLVPNDNGTV